MTDGGAHSPSSAEVPATSPTAPLTGEGGDSVGERLERLGWCQGAVLPSALVSAVVWFPGATVTTEPTDALITVVVSQDCDIVHDTLGDEPVVEVIAGVYTGKISSRYANLTNPRILQTEAVLNGSMVPIEFRAINRGVLARDQLLSHPPATIPALPRRTVEKVAALVARRYVRTSRPTAFEARLTSNRKNKLGELLVQHSDKLEDIFFKLPRGQERELSPDERYTCVICCLLKSAYAEACTLRELNATKALIKQQVNTIMRNVDKGGIDVALTMVAPPAEVYLAEFEGMVPLDLGWPHFVAEERQAAKAAELEARTREELRAAAALATEVTVDGPERT